MQWVERISGVAAFAAAASNTTICNIPNHDEGDGQSVIMKFEIHTSSHWQNARSFYYWYYPKENYNPNIQREAISKNINNVPKDQKSE